MVGGDWPHSDRRGTYLQILEIVREYFLAQAEPRRKNSFGSIRSPPLDETRETSAASLGFWFD